MLLFILHLPGGLVKPCSTIYTVKRTENVTPGSKMNKLIPIVGFLGVVASLPIWRGAGHSRHDGVSFWKLLYDSTRLTPDSPFGHPHQPYSEAVRQAGEAYQAAKEYHGI